MAEHTPGPWQTGHNLKFSHREETVWTDRTEYNTLIASLSRNFPGNETTANARLMAAALDLLAALEAVEWLPDEDSPGRLYCPWCGNYQEPYGHSLECERQAAIAKAKGENHAE